MEVVGKAAHAGERSRWHGVEALPELIDQLEAKMKRRPRSSISKKPPTCAIGLNSYARRCRERLERMQLFLIRAARQCRLFGWRKASALLLELASFSSKERSVARQLVIDLLAIGFIRRARNKILASRSNYKDLMSFEAQDKRFLDYIDWNVFSSRLESDLDESRRQLVSFLRESNYLAKNFPFDLSVYTDFILISNSRIHLSAQDVETLKCMKAPVFVFLNHANPAFQKLLVRHGLAIFLIWLSQVKMA